MRLDRYLHLAARLSRSQARKLVREKRVSVDGEPACDPAAHVPEAARIRIDGAPLAPPAPRFLMLHKPAGVICATSDPSQRTVIDLLPPEEGEGLHIAGRLDIDATGLVLLSDDGRWVHRVTSPRHKQPKVYQVTLAEPLATDAEKHLARGIFLKGEGKRTLPAKLELLSLTRVRITLMEGRYHQVKRMFAAIGNRVTALHRERIGKVELDPALTPGGHRQLTEEEIAGF